MTASEEILRAIRQRRSVRLYRNEPVGRDLLEQLVDAAQWAPSAGNRQDWFFTVVTARDTLQRMAQAVREKWKRIVDDNRDTGLIEEVERYASGFDRFAEAPAVVVISAKRIDAFQKQILGADAPLTAGGVTSAAMAAQNLMLAAHALGLGTCCMTGPLPASDALCAILGLRRHQIVCLVTVGRPAEEPEAPPRKPIEEIARFLE